MRRRSTASAALLVYTCKKNYVTLTKIRTLKKIVEVLTQRQCNFEALCGMFNEQKLRLMNKNSNRHNGWNKLGSCLYWNHTFFPCRKNNRVIFTVLVTCGLFTFPFKTTLLAVPRASVPWLPDGCRFRRSKSSGDASRPFFRPAELAGGGATQIIFDDPAASTTNSIRCVGRIFISDEWVGIHVYCDWVYRYIDLWWARSV